LAVPSIHNNYSYQFQSPYLRVFHDLRGEKYLKNPKINLTPKEDRCIMFIKQ
jgi:hypothetical protein